MSPLFKRLARLTRAHLYDFLEHRLSGWRQAAPWQADSEAQQEAETSRPFSTSSSKTNASNGLPYDPELVGYYRTLDLPFGTPLEEVTRRWKAYLKKCHPDRYANDPEKQADATQLTQELTRAYEKIKRAWERYQS